ncbi:MAG: DUF58 domain-containing protein, partial [Synechocystis sp.]
IQAHRLPLSHLSIGRDNAVTVTLRNLGNTTTIRLKDDYPAPFSPIDISQPVVTTVQLAPQSEQTVTYTVKPRQRGEYTWGKLNLQQRNPWGLGWQQWQVETPQTVAVYPDLLALKALTVRLSQNSQGALKQARRLGLGTEFRELRDYQAGDDLRYLDWKASARRGTPLMRVLEPEREQTVIILLDRGRLMTAWVKGLQRFDWGLNTTLALAVTALQRGDRVGIGVFDREVVTWLPPERGMQYLPKLLTHLTPLQPVLTEPDYVEAISRLVKQQTRRALVVCITDIIDPTASRELLSALLQLTPRYLPFCVALGDRQVEQLAQQETHHVTAAYQKAVALTLLQQRQLALAKLQQRGVLVLDAPADQVSEQLVDRYLQLKARMLL